jgi:hypothetical protein
MKLLILVNRATKRFTKDKLLSVIVKFDKAEMGPYFANITLAELP